MAIGLTPGMMFRGFGDPRGTPPYAPVDVPQAPEMTPGVGVGAVPAATPSFFDEGGLGRGIAGSIGDFLLQNSGMRPVYAPAMQERRQRQQQLQDRIAERQAANQDWVQRQIWQRDHPAPVNNDTVNDYNFIAGKLGEEAANQYLRIMGDPMVTVPLGQDRIYAGPRSGLGGALGASAAPAPQRPGIGSVIADPRKGGSGSGQSSFR